MKDYRESREYRQPFGNPQRNRSSRFAKRNVLNTQDERSWWDRAGDEMLSWLGDDYAEKRRRHDAIHRGKGPKNYRRSDDRIRDDIHDHLTDEWCIDASDIEVSVFDGEVTLSGYVADRFQKRRAEIITENVLGVQHVENRIRVQDTSSIEGIEFVP